MVCKKKEQCKFGKMCGWAKDEETLLTECVEFIERVPLTNEEWLRNLSFNELARVLYCMIINGERIRPDLAYIKQWLNEKHNESV